MSLHTKGGCTWLIGLHSKFATYRFRNGLELLRMIWLRKLQCECEWMCRSTPFTLPAGFNMLNICATCIIIAWNIHAICYLYVLRGRLRRIYRTPALLFLRFLLSAHGQKRDHNPSWAKGWWKLKPISFLALNAKSYCQNLLLLLVCVCICVCMCVFE